MSDSPQYSWICSECARRVPNRLDTCRCGNGRNPGSTGATEAIGAEGATSAIGAEDATGAEGATAINVEVIQPSPRASMLPWVVLSVVTLAAAGTLIALQVIPVKPKPVAAAEGTAPEPSVPPTAADGATFTAVEPTSFLAPVAPIPPIAPVSPGSLEDVISRAIPAIVSIEAGEGRGSGFFAAPRTVITNRHVVQDNVSVTVRLWNGQALPGRVESLSIEYDLAIVRVDSSLPSQAVLPLGTVNDVRPGQEVIAIGLALGVFQNSVTRGIISAVRRADRTVMLQTDAAINAGNSGGPLLNRQGQVVGINTLKVGGAAESLGFAVAADHSRVLLAGGKASEPFGTSAQQSRQLAPAFGARSSTDLMRDEGTKRYSQIVEAVGRQAVQLDTYWNRIKVNCPVRVAPGYDREWFGLWDGRAKLDTPDMSCGSAIQELEEMASEVRSAMGTAQEDARRASVLPGQLRDIRRRYRMDWPGFER